MSFLRIQFQDGAVHLPGLGLWLDAHLPQLGQERVFVSHAHSDHVAAHREVILSAPTAKLLEARIGGQRLEHVLEFGQRKKIGYEQTPFQLTLLPAGHIFGSAMLLVEAGGQSLLYTGDFKLRPGLSAEPCEPRSAEILIMETTYGRPGYAFPPTDAVMKSVVRFCREALDNDETPVLLGYSLGKSQEILRGLGDAGLPIMLHGSVYKLTKIYEQFGQCFPPYDRYEAGQGRGKVLLCPPNVINSAMLRNVAPARTAILTGWAVNSNCRFRYQCDAAFALSDHADFPELIELVKRVQPRKVYTLHGFAADFAQTLRELGYDAQALSQDEQFALPMAVERRASVSPAAWEGGALLSEETQGHDGRPTRRQEAAATGPAGHSHSFADFAQTCSHIAADSRKLEKVRVLAEYLRTLNSEVVPQGSTWFCGRPFPANQNRVLQLGWAVLRDALCQAASVPEAEFHRVLLKHSDLGETAFELLERRPRIGSSISMEEVNDLFQRLHAARGPLAKTPLLAEAVRRCTPIEAKYLVKIITGDLRIGLKEGLVEEGVAQAFSRPAEEVRKVHLLLGDIGETALLAAQNRLQQAELTPFRPIKFMLASPEETAAGVWQRMQTGQPIPKEEPADARLPRPAGLVWLEDKYDGIRSQLHKVAGRVALYSRDLKDTTTMFLELTDSARGLGSDVILDGEIVAMRGDEVLPFADLQKRLGRRQGDLFMREEVPIKFVAFDLLWLDAHSYLDRPLSARRAALESLTPLPESFRLATITQAASVEEINTAFEAARARNNEGLMIKDPASFYTPGRRGLAWLKLKKAFATLDCVVVGAEFGHGKRNKVLSDYTFSVRDEETGELKTIGKAYSGLTDAEISQLTEHFFQTAIRQHGRYFEVVPDTVLEIAFDRIQPSDRHNSGLAMRFPRILRIRTDKSVAEIDTLTTARKLAGMIQGR